jgi:hypothetical protein
MRFTRCLNPLSFFISLGLCVFTPPSPALAGSPFVTVLPLPTRDVSPPDQDLILANIAVQLRSQFKVRVLTGRSVRRAIWGTLGLGLGESSKSFTHKVQSGKKAYHMLQIGRARKLLKQAHGPLQVCGPEIRDPQLFVDLHVYSGLAALALGKKKAAAVDFRQAVAMDNKAALSPRQFPPDQVKAFDQAKRQLLAGKPVSVQFLSRPKGATVYLDGKRRGHTPMRLPVYPGYHFARVEKKGFSPWTLNLPYGVAPAKIRARLIPLWTGEAPEDLVATAIARKDLSESVRARLRLMSSFYASDAFLLVSLSRDGRQIHLGLRLFVVDPEIVTRARLFNLGDDLSAIPTKLKGIISTLKALKQARVRKAVAVAPAPSRNPTPAPVRIVPPRRRPDRPADSPLSPPSAVVPIDEQRDDDPRPGGRTAWYKSWWFWTITGMAVAGAAAGTTAWYLTQPEGNWTLVVQPN